MTPTTATRSTLGSIDLRPVPASRNRYAQHIASSRNIRDWSRAQLAQEIGVPEATIALWESPSYEGIDLSILERVAKATGLRLEVSFARPRERHQSASHSAEETVLERSTA